MGVIAENAIEINDHLDQNERYIHINVELSDRCSFQSKYGCGENCILTMRGLSKGQVMLPSQVLQATQEVLLSGSKIRHLALCGREPFEEQELMKSILQEYHSTPENTRPLYIGAISAAGKQISQADWLTNTPLSWLIVSYDDFDLSGMRTNGAGDSALDAALHLRKIGGTQSIGVNTIFVPGSEKQFLKMADKIVNSDIDQWYIAPKMELNGNKIESTATNLEMEEFARFLDTHIPSCSTRVMVSVGPQQVLSRLSAHEQKQVESVHQWRITSPLKNKRVELASIPDWIAFARLRWDGGIVDYMQKYTRFLPPEKTHYGIYQTGRMSRILSELGSNLQKAKKLHEVSA